MSYTKFIADIDDEHWCGKSEITQTAMSMTIAIFTYILVLPGRNTICIYINIIIIIIVAVVITNYLRNGKY